LIDTSVTQLKAIDATELSKQQNQIRPMKYRTEKQCLIFSLSRLGKYVGAEAQLDDLTLFPVLLSLLLGLWL